VSPREKVKMEEIEAAAAGSEPPAVAVNGDKMTQGPAQVSKLRQRLAQLRQAERERLEGDQPEEPRRRLDAKGEQHHPGPQRRPEASRPSWRADHRSAGRSSTGHGGRRPKRRSPSASETPPLLPEPSPEPRSPSQAAEAGPRKRRRRRGQEG
ncbi:unnamed protein product, partial [Prorocentrum cordatum]